MHCFWCNGEVTFRLLGEMPTEHHLRREIIRCGALLHTCGFIAATDGNLSVRLDGDRVLVTPTGMSKGMMKTSDLVIVDMEGRKLKGHRDVTSEIGMHLLVYRMRPDVNAVVHAHPRTATGFAAAGLALNQPLVCEVVIGLGQIPLAPYGTPGTPELADTLRPLIPDFDAILMANHGVVTYGTDLQSAYMKMETVEHFAQITLVTHMLGKQQPLECGDLEKLLAVRSRYMGVSSASRMPAFFSNSDSDELEEAPVGEGKSFLGHSIHHRRGSAFRRGN
jgi:L-fuculose-phosphate aldolase